MQCCHSTAGDEGKCPQSMPMLCHIQSHQLEMLNKLKNLQSLKGSESRFKTGEATQVQVKSCAGTTQNSCGEAGTGSGQLIPAPDTGLTVQDWARLIKTHVVHLDQLGVAALGLPETLGWGLELHPQNTKATNCLTGQLKHKMVH